MTKDSDGLTKLSKKKAAQLSRIIESSIVNAMKKNAPIMRQKEALSRDKVKEIEKQSKARRYQFKVSELDSNINLKNYLIDKIENMGLQSAKSQVSGKIDMFLNDVFRVQNLKNQARYPQKVNNYEDKLRRLNKAGVVNHPYKIPYKKIYERGEKKNLLNSYYSDRANGRKIEFLDTRIPTPKMKTRSGAREVKELFMDRQIKNYSWFTNLKVRIEENLKNKKKEKSKIRKAAKSIKKRLGNNKMSVNGLNKVFSNLAPRKDAYLSDADVYNFIKDNKGNKDLESSCRSPSLTNKEGIFDNGNNLNSTHNSSFKQAIKTPLNKNTIFTSLDSKHRYNVNTSKLEKRAKSTAKEGMVNVTIKDKSLNIHVEESKLSPRKYFSNFREPHSSKSNFDSSKYSTRKLKASPSHSNRICERIKRSKREIYAENYSKLKSASPCVSKIPAYRLLKPKCSEQESSKLRSKVLSFVCKLDGQIRKTRPQRRLLARIRPKKVMELPRAPIEVPPIPSPDDVLNLDLEIIGNKH
ncbi:unnamed protein product [Moneuplotes crassus]|uniref:Uncharacterized protein n=2 Tax=Euplotes crassus TaxID=5936 RepID=A0AAD1U7E0_EUPCR|nr:unnamed protein product [Moneuplotes crassus]